MPAWIYRATGRQSAPISRDALERLIKGGQLNGKALIRRSMDAKWLAIANTEFSSLLPKPAERPTAPRPHLLSLLRNDLRRVRFTKEQIVSAIVFAILFTPVACVMEMHNNYVAEVKIKEAAAADFHTRVIDLGRLGDVIAEARNASNKAKNVVDKEITENSYRERLCREFPNGRISAWHGRLYDLKAGDEGVSVTVVEFETSIDFRAYCQKYRALQKTFFLWCREALQER